MSVTFPDIAAAATIAGLINNVLPVGDPCLPLKFLLLELALTWLPISLSEFIAKHIEQPGSLHWKPASRKILSSPSIFASLATFSDPGTTNAYIFWDTFLSFITSAATLKSLILPLVQLPMKQTSIGVYLIDWPCLKPIYS